MSISLDTLNQTYLSMKDCQLKNDDMSTNELYALYVENGDERIIATLFVRVYKLALNLYLKKYLYVIPQEEFCDMLMATVYDTVRRTKMDMNFTYNTYLLQSLVNRCSGYITYQKTVKKKAFENDVLYCGTLITPPDEDSFEMDYISKLIYEKSVHNPETSEIEFMYELDKVGLTKPELAVVKALMQGYTFNEIKKLLSLSNSVMNNLQETLYYKFSHARQAKLCFSVV